MTGSLINYFTTFESTNNLPMNIEIGHGESADLVASFKDAGVDVNLSGYTAMAIFQPKSKWGTDEWYECPCEIADNTIIVHWDYASDNGDSAVKLFIYATKDGVIAYPAIYQIKLFNTPGFDPHPIAPVPKIIDFSQYTLLNAPWAMLSSVSELSGTVDGISQEVSDLDANKANSSDVNELAENVGALTNNLSILTETVGGISTSVTSLSGRMSTAEANIASEKNLIFGTINEQSPVSHNNYNIVLMDRKLISVRVRSFYYNIQWGLKLPENRGQWDQCVYCVVDFNNTLNPTHNVYLSIVQPNVGKWNVAVDDSLTLNEVLTVPAGKIARFYISEVGGYVASSGNNWGMLYIKRELLKDVTP